MGKKLLYWIHILKLHPAKPVGRKNNKIQNLSFQYMYFIFILGLLAPLAKVINYLTAAAQTSLFYCLIKSKKYKSILGPFLK